MQINNKKLTEEMAAVTEDFRSSSDSVNDDVIELRIFKIKALFLVSLAVILFNTILFDTHSFSPVSAEHLTLSVST